MCVFELLAQLKRFFLYFLLLISQFLVVFCSEARSEEGQIFRAYDVLQIEIKAPFKSFLTFMQKTKEKSIQGVLSYRNSKQDLIKLNVKISKRGHSTRELCPFPKLSIAFRDRDENWSNSIFSNITKIKLNTHCRDVSKNDGSHLDNLDQRIPHRESLAYRIIEMLGFESFKTRPVKVAYVDSEDGNKVIIRNAMFLESVKDFERRTGLREKGYDDYVYDSRSEVKVESLRVLLEDSDWQPKIFIGPDGKNVSVPYDLNHSNMVYDPSLSDQSLNSSYFEKLSLIETYMSTDFQEFRTAYNRYWDSILIDLIAQKQNVYAMINSSTLSYTDAFTGQVKFDEQGKENIILYFETFFKLAQSTIDSKALVTRPE